jgi:hypothetical protein
MGIHTLWRSNSPLLYPPSPQQLRLRSYRNEFHRGDPGTAVYTVERHLVGIFNNKVSRLAFEFAVSEMPEYLEAVNRELEKLRSRVATAQRRW